MTSKNIVFTAPKTVALLEEPTAALGPGQILVRAEHSLVSTGTELICLAGEFEPGSHWDNWVKFPFYPGYNRVGIVEEVGAGVSDYAVGDRVASRTNHKQWSSLDCGPASRTLKVPCATAKRRAATLFSTWRQRWMTASRATLTT